MDVNLKKGDVIICVLSGDYGKGRPAVVIQSDLFNDTHASIVVCPITTHLIDAPLFRIPLDHNHQNGLESTSQIMIDKMTAIRREKIREKIGALTVIEQKHLNQGIRLWLELMEA